MKNVCFMPILKCDSGYGFCVFCKEKWLKFNTSGIVILEKYSKRH
jgi:hypothetical protein